MVKIIELRPDRELINKDFEKYQFCADRIPISSEFYLEEEVYRIEPNSNQESLLEARLFAFHNHLFKNPYDMSCWFIDKKWGVWRLYKSGEEKQVYVLHKDSLKLVNLTYNPSIGFTTNNITVISDGGCTLKLLMGYTNQDLKSFDLENSEPGVILDVKCVTSESKLIVAMCAIKTSNEKKYTEGRLLTYAWKNANTDNESFEFLSTEAFRIHGSLEYLYIGDNGKYIHTLAQDSITFENRVSVEPQSGSEEPEESKKRNPKYCWSQDEDSLTVWIKVEKKDQHKVNINVTPTQLSIVYEGSVILEGQCYHRVDENLTTWKHEQNKFQIELIKYESGLMWNELIIGDTQGEYIQNEALVAEIHNRLAHLCSEQVDKDARPCVGFNTEQLEECDLEGKDNVLQRIDLGTQEITHTAMFGSNNHVLFTYKKSSGQVICLRHDHDGCVWITEEGDSITWNMRNVHVFPGFGYVEASKTNKKFCNSPANGSYVAIVEHKRHIFLYENPQSNTKVAKQWIIDLGAESYPIMGAVAMNKCLIILTKHVLYYLKIYS